MLFNTECSACAERKIKRLKLTLLNSADGYLSLILLAPSPVSSLGSLRSHDSDAKDYGHLRRGSVTFSNQRTICSFHFNDLPRTAKKCTKIYNARAQPLSSSLNLLFSDVAIAVEVSLSPLVLHG